MHGSSLRESALIRITMLLLITTTLGGGAASQGKRTPAATRRLARAHQRVGEAASGVMLEDAEPITNQVQKLVVDHMEEWMANRTPTDVETRRELEDVFSLLHYPEVAVPAAFAFPWKGQMVIGAGYTFGWTDFDRQNVVAVFASKRGQEPSCRRHELRPSHRPPLRKCSPACLGRPSVLRLW